MSNKQLELIQGGKIRDGFTVGKDTVNNAFYKGRVVLPKQWPLAQALSTGKSVVGKEFHIRRRDGKDMHVQVSASLVRNREGKVIAAASIINDITALIELEARKDDFVNMASHELKTPITSLKLYIDVLKRVAKEYKDEKVKRTLKGIEYQTDRLQQLVSDLLDVSRLQTGKLVFSREKFRIDMLVEEIVEGLRGSVMGHRIVIKEKPHLVVYADRFRIYQVVTNLLTNAIKYSPEGSIITVSVREDKKYAVVAIKDQGIGISKDQQSKIFDRLYQVTDSREKTFPGLGMGLYISKEIIKRHRGRIWVESEKGKGSTFFFSLPLKS